MAFGFFLRKRVFNTHNGLYNNQFNRNNRPRFIEGINYSKHPKHSKCLTHKEKLNKFYPIITKCKVCSCILPENNINYIGGLCIGCYHIANIANIANEYEYENTVSKHT